MTASSRHAGNDPGRHPDPIAKLEIGHPAPQTLRRYGLLLGAVLAGGLLAVAALNVVANPRAEFPTRAYQPLVADSVAWKVDLLDDFGKPDVLVVGSSRSMGWPPQVLANGSGFNFGLFAATPLDLDYVWEHVASSQGVPDVLVIAADPFSLQPPAPHYTSKVEESVEASRVAGHGPAWGTLVLRALRSVALDYVEDSLRVLRYSHVSGYPPSDVQFDADGLRQRPLTDAEVAAGTYDVESHVLEHAHQTLPKVYGLPSRYGEQLPIDGGQLEQWEDLFARVRANGTHVVAIMPPIHPLGVAIMSEEPGFQQFQDAMRDLLVDHCGPLFEAFDYTEVATYGGDTGGFYDSFHTDVANGRLILKATTEGRGRLCP